MQGSNSPNSKPAGVQGSLLVFDQAKSEAAAAFNELTDMQRKYAEARLAGMIPLHAAQSAGYSTPQVNAYRLEKHPAIQKALINARRMVVEKFDVNREDVLRGMFDAVQASATATELVAAWREIGRIIGAYEPSKLEVMHRVEDVTLDKLQRLSTKELIELAEGTDFVVEAKDDKFSGEYRQVYDAIMSNQPRNRFYGSRKPATGDDPGDELSSDGGDIDDELSSDGGDIDDEPVLDEDHS